MQFYVVHSLQVEGQDGFVSTKVSNSIMALYKSIYLLTFLLTYLRNLFSSRDETETDKFLHNSTNMALRYCQADHLHYITLSVFHVCTLHKTRNLFANKLLDNNVFTVVIKGFISNLVLQCFFLFSLFLCPVFIVRLFSQISISLLLCVYMFLCFLLLLHCEIKCIALA